MAPFCAAWSAVAISFSAQSQTKADEPSAQKLAEAALVVVQPEIQDIYLMIGQLNMSAVTPVGALDKDVLENVYLFNESERWEKATNTTPGFNRYSSARRGTNPSRSHRLNAGTSFRCPRGAKKSLLFKSLT